MAPVVCHLPFNPISSPIISSPNFHVESSSLHSRRAPRPCDTCRRLTVKCDGTRPGCFSGAKLKIGGCRYSLPRSSRTPDKRRDETLSERRPRRAEKLSRSSRIETFRLSCVEAGRGPHRNVKALVRPVPGDAACFSAGGSSPSSSPRLLPMDPSYNHLRRFAYDGVDGKLSSWSDDQSSDCYLTVSDSGISGNASCASIDAYSSEDEDVLLSRVEQKQLLLDRLMQYFDSKFTSCQPIPTTSYPRDASGSVTSASGISGTSPALTTDTSSKRLQIRLGKRPVGDEDDGQDGDDEDNHKRKRTTAVTEESLQRLACPFFKRNPQKYREERSCVGPGWRTVHRVKEHLYRCHMLSIHCFRCHKAFATDYLLQAHMRTDPPCPIRLQVTTEGINAAQEKLLRSRKKAQKNMTEEEKWRDVYRILFSTDGPDLIPGPYYDIGTLVESEGDNLGNLSELARYEEFLRQELPPRVRNELESQIEDSLGPMVEEGLKRQLVDIVRNMQIRLFEVYKGTRGLVAESEQEKGESSNGFTNTQQQHPIPQKPSGSTIMSPSTSSDESMTAAPNREVLGDSFTSELEAFRPDPFFGGNLDGFDGLLFDLSGEASCDDWHDSGYDTMAWPSERESSPNRSGPRDVVSGDAFRGEDEQLCSLSE